MISILYKIDDETQGSTCCTGTSSIEPRQLESLKAGKLRGGDYHFRLGSR